MSHSSSSEKPNPTRPQRATAGQLPSRFKQEPSPEHPTPRKKRTTRVSLPARIKPEPSPELPTPPKEPRQLFEMSSGSQTPAQPPRTAQSQVFPGYQPRIGVTRGPLPSRFRPEPSLEPLPRLQTARREPLEPQPLRTSRSELPLHYRPESSTALPTPEDTSNASNSSEDNNVSPEPATIPTPDNTSNALNSSGNNNVPPEPKIYSGEKRIYVYPKDHPYDEGLPEHWGREELAKWDAIKQEKIREGEAEWDKMISDHVWNRKKKGVFVYWEWLKDGRRYRWVLCKEDPSE